MPWKASSSRSYTKAARTPKRRQQWAAVANSVLKRTGSESRAIRAANSVIKKRGRSRRARR